VTALTTSFEESAITICFEEYWEELVHIHGLVSIMKHSSNFMELDFCGYASMGHEYLFFTLRKRFLEFHYGNTFSTRRILVENNSPPSIRDIFDTPYPSIIHNNMKIKKK
jgi:hypothetical protein